MNIEDVLKDDCFTNCDNLRKLIIHSNDKTKKEIIYWYNTYQELLTRISELFGIKTSEQDLQKFIDNNTERLSVLGFTKNGFITTSIISLLLDVDKKNVQQWFKKKEIIGTVNYTHQTSPELFEQFLLSRITKEKAKKYRPIVTNKLS